MTKAKVIQIGFIIALLGIIIFKSVSFWGLNDEINTSISSLILISLLLIWVLSYISRVVGGNMTFMEQRKRYREKYEKVMEEKIENKFSKLSTKEQEELLKKIKD